MNPAILQQALARVERLGEISDSPAGLVRTFLSPANRVAAEQVMEWMRGLGMEAAHDAGGTVRGILPGTDGAARPLLLGSHLDTVIDAGKYDGALGIIAALAALEVLAGEGVALPYPVHLLGFSDEEGVRFQSTYLGSRGVLGPLEPWLLARRDGAGKTLSEVLETEGWHDGAADFRYDAANAAGYVELHIEQGRMLEERGYPACVVTGICGQARVRIVLTGLADHAGTTPMHLRRDALAGAAECVLVVEKLAAENPPLVGTVGKLEVRPGASNAIPQTAEFTVDLRHPDDEFLAIMLDTCRTKFDRIAVRRSLDLVWETVQQNDAVACDGDLLHRLLDSLEAVTGSRGTLASGAGHDGVILSTALPVGMIFVRCRAGLSHHPEEYTAPEDIGMGIAVLVEFLKRHARP